jgi:Flp pilus assembly protein TadG
MMIPHNGRLFAITRRAFIAAMDRYCGRLGGKEIWRYDPDLGWATFERTSVATGTGDMAGRRTGPSNYSPRAPRQALWNCLDHFIRRDRHGGALVIVGLALPVLLGMTALSVDLGLWYKFRRDYQTASDAAAIGAAWQRLKGKGGLYETAKSDAARNGVIVGGASKLEVNNPPTSGQYAGEPEAVEVVVTVAESTMLSSLVYSGSVTNVVRAVGLIEITGQACVLALNSTAPSALKVWGNTNVEAKKCVLGSNSNASNAIDIGGSSQLTAETLWSAGGVQTAGTTTLEKPPITEAWALDDPYKHLTVGAMGSCTVTNPPNYNSTATLSPGRYCGSVSFGAQANITLQPGTYYIDKGDLTVNGGAKIRCDCTGTEGVTFVLTSSGSPSDSGTVTINGGADIQLNAPTDPNATYKGVLFYQDQGASANLAKFNGGASMILNGAIYFQKAQIQYNGDHSASAKSCTQIIGDTIEFTGNSKIINNGCADAGIEPINVKGVRLVE